MKKTSLCSCGRRTVRHLGVVTHTSELVWVRCCVRCGHDRPTCRCPVVPPEHKAQRPRQLSLFAEAAR